MADQPRTARTTTTEEKEPMATTTAAPPATDEAGQAEGGEAEHGRESLA